MAIRQVGIVDGREVGQALNMIPMKMGEKDLGLRVGEGVPQGANAAACVDNQQRLTGMADGEAGRVPSRSRDSRRPASVSIRGHPKNVELHWGETV